MSRIFKLFHSTLLLFVGLYTSCISDDSLLEPERQETASVTLLTAPYGLGDNGYNDCIASGVFAFAEQNDINVRLLLPNSEAEAREMYADWLSDNAVSDSAVIILGSSIYESLAEETPFTLKGEGSRVLLAESNSENLPTGVTTFMINRYGVSYLAGAMSKDFDALVFAAAPGYVTLESAICGFLDGHMAYKDSNRTSEVIYLAEDESGFAMPDSAYRVMARRMQDHLMYDEIVFPLLGGSATGVLRCINDSKFSMALIVGMDVDQTGRSSRIPYSIVVHIDCVIHQYLKEWRDGNEWQRKQTLGMKDRVVDMVFTPNFFEYLNIWDDRYEDPETFVKLYEEFYTEALQKEIEYEIF